MVYLTMTNNPLDVIDTKFCREHQCFKAFRNGSCISCEEEKSLEQIAKAENKERKMIRDGIKADKILIDDVQTVKRGRGRPKGSKKKS